MQITCAARTDVGVIRSGNEDNFLVLPDDGVFIVADGMGGHAAGEVASEMAVTLIAQTLGNTRGLSDEQLAQRMRDAISRANSAIFERTLAEPEKRGMGTTVTAMVMRGNRFLIGQVGDSRAYILRDSRLVQVTKDHSYVQEQVDAGHLTPEQARSHPYSNVITRCVGANAEVVPDLYIGAARTADVFLLASDGLTGMLEDHELMEVLSAEHQPPRQVEGLIEAANRRGGLDNITAIVVRVDEVDAPEGAGDVTTEHPAIEREKGRRTSGETTAGRT
ncbi:MAG: Stp1/IreP family PP2C-type Ser/Thr phosphatase [Gemmatimonadales bacterium]